MKKLKFHKTFVILVLMVGIALMVTLCSPVYVHGDYGNRRLNYGYGYGIPHRYARPAVIVPNTARLHEEDIMEKVMVEVEDGNKSRKP